MKVLVTGVTGQLGYDVCKILTNRNIKNQGVGRSEFDITNRHATLDYISKYEPDVVIHCSAYTSVDKAEDDEECCTKVNTEGTRNIADACKCVGAKMIYISTDYVFPGCGDKFYKPEDKTDPLCVYGKTKLYGEFAVQEILDRYFIVRISWVFGKNGKNFINTMLHLAETQDEINVVCDQIGSPTYTVDLAELLCSMLITDKYGVYHVTNEGTCSWADFAKEIFRQVGKTVKVNNIPTNKYPTRAVRPLNSRMSKEKLVNSGFNKLPTWQSAVTRYLKSINEIS